MEIGCGSGSIILAISKCEGRDIAIDMNYEATKLTKQNAEMNGCPLQVIAGHFNSPIRKGGMPKNVLFNPPYLPADPEMDKSLSDNERLALIGGQRGDETAWDMINRLESSQQAFIIFSSIATTPTEIKRRGQKEFHRDVEIVGELSLGLETLWAIQFKSQKESPRAHP